uniref:Tetratricopeptide repeat protein 19 n=1 Tax=Magallana gigas TaxID=29159 RepID=K1QBX4_MAGGI
MSYSTWKSTLGLMLKLPRTFKWKFPKQFNHAVFNTTFTQQRFKDAFEKLYKSMRLAAIYAMMGKEEETHSGFQFCIKTQEDKIKENPDESSYTYGLLGMCLENYAKFLVNAKQYDKALEYLQRAEEVVVRYLGEEHPQRIVALNDIGTVHILKEDYDKAEKVLKKALAIGHACKDETLPVLYSNLGALYLRQSKVDKALEMCKTGEKIGTEMGHSEAVKRAKFCIEKCEEEE